MLQKYKVYKKNSPSKICIDLVKYIQKYVSKNKSIKKMLSDINDFYKIPNKILDQKTYQIIFSDFNFKKNKFERYENFYLIIDILKYYLIVLINIFFHKKKIGKQKNYNLICDNVFDQNDVDRYSNLIKIFKNVCLLGSFINKKKIKSEEYFRYKILNIGNSDLSLKKKFFFFKLGFKILIFSIADRTNYFRIFSLLVYDILRSNHIFSNIKAKFFFTNKFYGTSPIFNFYFKKSGGLKSSCFQKNILAYSLSCFVYSDILFTLGKGQGRICHKLGGKIKKIIPVGSLYMENAWFNKKKDLKNVPNSNILILGINTLKNTRHYVNNIYENSYYNLFLDWINQLALDFPNLKIVYKHHNDYLEDPKERKKLSNSKVEILIKNKSINSSYAYAYKSELTISFASTMILEILGHGKKAFFIDPNLKGSQWFDDIKNIKEYRIGSYELLKKIVKNRTKLSKVSRNHKDFYCLESDDTSKKIANYLMQKASEK